MGRAGASQPCQTGVRHWYPVQMHERVCSHYSQAQKAGCVFVSAKKDLVKARAGGGEEGQVLRW